MYNKLRVAGILSFLMCLCVRCLHLGISCTYRNPSWAVDISASSMTFRSNQCCWMRSWKTRRILPKTTWQKWKSRWNWLVKCRLFKRALTPYFGIWGWDFKIRIFVEYWGKKLYTSIQISYFEFDVYIFLVILRNMIRKLSFYIYKSVFLIFGDKINLSDTLIQFLKRYLMTVPVLDNWEPYNFVEYLVHTKSMWL